MDIEVNELALHRLLMLLQGIYYVATGLWPLVHVSSFEAITGPKRDKFTLHTAGSLIVIVGAFLLAASKERQPDPRFAALGVSAAIALASVVAAHARRIRPVYWLEAIVEVSIAAALLLTRRSRINL